MHHSTVLLALSSLAAAFPLTQREAGAIAAHASFPIGHGPGQPLGSAPGSGSKESQVYFIPPVDFVNVPDQPGSQGFQANFMGSKHLAPYTARSAPLGDHLDQTQVYKIRGPGSFWPDGSIGAVASASRNDKHDPNHVFDVQGQAFYWSPEAAGFGRGHNCQDETMTAQAYKVAPYDYTGAGIGSGRRYHGSQVYFMPPFDMTG